MFTVYVLKSQHFNYHYIGHTQHITSRLKSHNQGKVKSSRPFRPFIIIHTEAFNTRSEAFQREMYLKSGEGNFWIRQMLTNLGKW